MFPSCTVFGKVFERKADKYCSILKSHCRNSKANRAINHEMAKILKEKGFNDVWSSGVKFMQLQKISDCFCKNQSTELSKM